MRKALTIVAILLVLITASGSALNYIKIGGEYDTSINSLQDDYWNWKLNLTPQSVTNTLPSDICHTFTASLTHKNTLKAVKSKWILFNASYGTLDGCERYCNEGGTPYCCVKTNDSGLASVSVCSLQLGSARIEAWLNGHRGHGITPVSVQSQKYWEGTPPSPLMNLTASGIPSLVLGGGTVRITATVENNGNVPLTNTSVRINGNVALFDGGDTNTNSILDPNESWSYYQNVTIPWVFNQFNVSAINASAQFGGQTLYQNTTYGYKSFILRKDISNQVIKSLYQNQNFTVSGERATEVTQYTFNISVQDPAEMLLSQGSWTFTEAPLSIPIGTFDPQPPSFTYSTSDYGEMTFVNALTPAFATITACKENVSAGNLSGWRMILGDPAGNFSNSSTGEDGCTVFVVHDSGTYTLSEDVQPGWQPVSPIDPIIDISVTVSTEGSAYSSTFVNKEIPHEVPYATISACKEDTSTGESLPQWVVTITNGTTAWSQATNDTAGCTAFSVTANGTWTVTEVVKDGWTNITPTSHGFTVELGGHYRPYTFVNTKIPAPHATITACKQDGQGTNLSGWKMNLLGSGGFYQSNSTDATGCTVLSIEELGTYHLFESMQENWTKVAPDEASIAITIDSFEDYGTFTFTNEEVLHPIAWIYACKNDTSDTLLPGWQMNLLGEDESYQNGMTDQTGCTVFTVNATGNYTLFESMQENWTKQRPFEAGYKIQIPEVNGMATFTFTNERVIEPSAWVYACKNDTEGKPLLGWEMTLSHNSILYVENGLTDNTGCTVFTVERSTSVMTALLIEESRAGWINLTPREVGFEIPVIPDISHPITSQYTFTNAIERAAIAIEKSTNGYDADEAPGPSIRVGSTVNWSYVVTNSGTVPLADITITDNQEGIISTIPTLNAGESIPLYHEGKAKNGLYSNIGNVTAWYKGTIVTDEDASHYTGTTPGPTPPPRPSPRPPIGYVGGGGYSGRDCDYIENGTLATLSNGLVPMTVTICAVDGIGRLIIDGGTIALTPGGSALPYAVIVPLLAGQQEENPGYAVTEFGYDLSPYASTFKPPITLSLKFAPEQWAALYEKDLVFRLWNRDTGQWEDIPISSDAERLTLSGRIGRLDRIGLFERVPVVPPATPGVQPTPSEVVTPTPVVSLLYLLVALLILLAFIIALWRRRRAPEEEVIIGPEERVPSGGYAVTPPFEAERESAFASIITILNDVDAQLRDLEATVSRGSVFSPQAATAIVDKFFYTTQVAEERMKNPDVRKFLTSEQLEQLTTQLSNAVTKMKVLSRQSEPLLNALQARYGEVKV